VADTEPAWLTHRIDGRARIKLPERRGDAPHFAKVAEELRALPGVVDVQANALTGGLLVLHEGPLEPILTQARSKRLFEVNANQPAAPPVAERLRRQLGKLSGELRQDTGGESDLASLIFLVLMVGAIIQLLRGNFLAPAVSLLWYALSAVLLLPGLGGGQEAAGTGSLQPRETLERPPPERKAA